MAKVILHTSVMTMIWINNGDDEDYFEEDGYDFKDIDTADDDYVEYHSIASDIIRYI